LKTYILGDIHGEYDVCLEILRNVKLVDDKGRWEKGLGVRLIQVGDVIDRGDDPVRAFNLLRRLQEEAKAEGGEVIRLLGNHELSYIGGPVISNRSEGYILADAIKYDILDNKILAAYLLDDWVVVHAGLTKRLSKGKGLRELVDGLNKKLVDAVKDDDFSDEIFFVGPSRGGYKAPGIFWADYDVDLLPYEEELINQIVGHSPTYGTVPEIKKSKLGRLINVDIGMCKRYGGNKGILEYEDNNFKELIF
jgi:hypothetical protein